MAERVYTTGTIIEMRLIRLGLVLFLLGLVSGLVTGMMANPRMGLSAHMQGVTNGVFLLALGAIWTKVHLPSWGHRAAFWLLAYGTVINWLSTSLAAFWGTGKMTPIVSPNPTAKPWQETMVSIGLLSLTLAMLAGTILVLAGLFRTGDSESN